MLHEELGLSARLLEQLGQVRFEGWRLPGVFPRNLPRLFRHDPILSYETLTLSGHTAAPHTVSNVTGEFGQVPQGTLIPWGESSLAPNASQSTRIP